MHRRCRPVVVFALLSLFLGLIPASARTPVPSSQATPEPPVLDGLMEGVTRQYTPDPELVPSENPGAFAIITAHVFRFDTADQAEAAWWSLQENATWQMEPLAGAHTDEVVIHEEERDDLGDRAYTVWLSTNPQDGITGHFRALYVQDGEMLYVVTAIAGNEQSTLMADELARAMTQRDAGPGPASFHADGSSTGGLWDTFPATDDDILDNLVAFKDREIAVP